MQETLIGKSVPVLDKGFVELQALMGDDLAIVNAARVSFLGESKGADADKKLLFYLMKHRHTTPFEMCEFKFRIRAPLITFWQLVRHRTASINMQSGRYTPFEEDDFYEVQHDEWRLQSKSNKQGSSGQVLGDWEGSPLTRKLRAHYAEGFKLYQEALAEGVSKEQARLFLPGFAVYYTMVWKIDAHNLLHFLSLRRAEEAQYEIRVYADTIWNEFFKPALPWTAEAYESLTGTGFS